MKNKNRRGFWALTAMIGMLSAALIGAVILFFQLPPAAAPAGPAATGSADRPEASRSGDSAAALRLTKPEDYLPDHLMLGTAAPEAQIENEQGRTVPVRELAAGTGKGLWMVFWASWCPDCTRQFAALEEMRALAAEYGVTLVLTDRMESGRESREAALEKLKEFQVESLIGFDSEGACYRLFGMHEIPSSVLINPEGTVLNFTTGVKTPGQYRGMLESGLKGRDTAGLAYILSHLSNGDGGIYTSDRAGTEHPAGRDILSESQGLIMLYALEADRPDLFGSVWEYTRRRMMTEGLPAWYVTADGKKASVNALTDDLRIWYALTQAAEKWNGDYGSEADRLKEAIGQKCIHESGGYADYTDFTSGKQAGSISLCYLDPLILQSIAGDDPAMRAAAENGIRVLLQGQISDSFPLYYSSYSYETGQYSEENLNTAEALYTLWNLSRAGMLPDQAARWVRDHVLEGNLAARYHTDGTAVRGYEYHSTAVYALAALIAMETGDRDTQEAARRLMDRMRVDDAEDSLYGAYAQRGSEIRSFDQLMPLLVNGRKMGETRE